MNEPMDVLSRFRQHARRTPDAPAMHGPATTYASLDRNASAAAAELQDMGVSAGSIIALIFSDHSALVAQILGAMRIGAVFAPIDPVVPRPRLEAMLGRIRPALIIVEDSLRDRLAYIDGLPHRSSWMDPRSPRVTPPSGGGTGDQPAAPTAPCYTYFTSGSTGVPKAIRGNHRGLAHFIDWEIGAFGVTAGTRVGQLTPPSFDPFLRDVFVPLCSGGTICFPPERPGAKSLLSIVDWLDEAEVELIHCTPTLFRAILRSQPGATAFPKLRRVALAGEQLYGRDVKAWHDRFGERVALTNLYGPTETTLAKFCHEIRRSDGGRDVVPVGRPIPGAKALILDGADQVCPTGVVGEIVIRTAFRTDGYLDDPVETSRRFVPNPFSADPSDLVYRTGDLARSLDDGSYEIVGRRDNQVKVRGVRIELEEIEHVLRGAPAVREAIVRHWQDERSDSLLAAYLTGEGGIDLEGVKAHVLAHLPESHLPAHFTILAEMPIGITGKIDRRALPRPEFQPSGRTYVAPRNDTERRLAAIWKQVLGLGEDVGISDNFFALGGHSLSATQVLSLVRREFDVEVPLRRIFDQPTVEHMALAIIEVQASEVDEETLACLIAEVRAGQKSEAT